MIQRRWKQAHQADFGSDADDSDVIEPGGAGQTGTVSAVIVLWSARRRVLLVTAIEIEVVAGIQRIGVRRKVLMFDLEAIVDDGHVDALPGGQIPGVLHAEIHAGSGEVPLLWVERIVDFADQSLLLRHHAREDGREFPCALFGEGVSGVERGEGIRIGDEHPAIEEALFVRGRLGGGEFAPIGLLHVDEQFGGHDAAGVDHAQCARGFRERGQLVRRREAALVIENRRERPAGRGAAGPDTL